MDANKEYFIEAFAAQNKGIGVTSISPEIGYIADIGPVATEFRAILAMSYNILPEKRHWEIRRFCWKIGDTISSIEKEHGIALTILNQHFTDDKLKKKDIRKYR